MSWQDYNLARQLLVEERIGTRIRESQQAEAAQFKSSTAKLKRST